ncbi:Hypothetical predicted protein [Olea europaea subsp. europaea]|uniref:Uncharacterized protein n=1 Tax=Olea europaea subsp. europaea TaxID=158383 RepID=A0A8S0S5Z7_OLEEU|nr:Hypothetical predicted protein [Olea europaea subsp. europaea]
MSAWGLNTATSDEGRAMAWGGVDTGIGGDTAGNAAFRHETVLSFQNLKAMWCCLGGVGGGGDRMRVVASGEGGVGVGGARQFDVWPIVWLSVINYFTVTLKFDHL